MKKRSAPLTNKVKTTYHSDQIKKKKVTLGKHREDKRPLEAGMWTDSPLWMATDSPALKVQP